MGLIRSEHANDQAVVAAKEEVAAMDRELEEARTRLENRERKQYHEEQIWSDTIRRNSTWITFVLMGFNILLLLSTTALIEPWRRKRMVKEIKAALEEQSLLRAEPAKAAAIEREIDEVIEPVGVSLDSFEELSISTSTEPVSVTATPIDEVKTDETPLPTVQEAATNLPVEPTTKPTLLDHGKNNADRFKHQIQDLFSEKPVTVRKVDVTAVALEGAAVGAALVGLLIVLLKPR
jgi:sensitive to high expression protein 9, mitochondrial